MVSTNSLKKGMTLDLDGELWQVVQHQHHKPGKGQAVVRTKLKSVESGKVVERTFRSAEDVPQAILRARSFQLLYRQGEDYVFMDTETYEQRLVPPEVLGDRARYVVEGQTIEVELHDNQIVTVSLPAAVELEVTETDPGLAGDTATSATKPATLETGLEVKVPLFVEEGDLLKIDTRTGEYLSRA